MENKDILDRWTIDDTINQCVVKRTRIEVSDLRENRDDQLKLNAFTQDVAAKPDIAWIALDAAYKVNHVYTAAGSATITTYARPDKDFAKEHAWTTRDEKLCKRFDGTSAYINAPGAGVNYYHWMLEVLPRLEIIHAQLKTGAIDRVVIVGDVKPFKLQSIELFFPDIKEKITFLEKPVARFERLVFFQNFRQDTRFTESAYRFINRIRRLKVPQSILFVERGANNTRRKLLNEALLIERLGPYRVQPLTGELLSVRDQELLFSDSKMTIGVHGAGLTNIMFSPPGSKLIEITSRQYINRVTFSDLAVGIGMAAHVVVVDEDGGRDKVVANVGNNLIINPGNALSTLIDIVSKNIDA